MKSEFAAVAATELGYKNIHWYKEGIKGWKTAGYTTESTLDILHKAEAKAIQPPALMDKVNKKEKLFLVDIRDSQSREKNGIIGGTTLHYPLFRLHKLYWELPKDRLLVLYDVTGNQAPTACRYLSAVGFDPGKIAYLEGGMAAWLASGLPLQKKQPEPQN